MNAFVRIVAVFAAAMLVRHAAAQVLLDQQFDPFPNAPTGFAVGPRDVAQEFTVGRTGKIVGADVSVRLGQVPALGDLIVELRLFVGGAPTLPSVPALASAIIPRANVGANYAFLPADFSAANLHVTTGEVLALVLRDPLSSAPTGPFTSYDWKTGNGYPGGGMFTRDVRNLGESAPWALNQNTINDVAFRTFVQIPEPAAGTMAAAAIASLGAFFRRQL
jgi:hypothetical protein